MFFLKCVSFTVGFMNEWSVASVPWFLEEMKPLLDTSNAFTVHWYCVISVTKCAYLLLFSMWRVSMCSRVG